VAALAALAAVPRWTVEQYLELERAGSTRHEYVDGVVYALAGGTQAHSVIAINVAALLRAAVRGGPCRVFSADMKVRVAERRFLYPDASVGCDPADRRDADDWLGAPRLVVEVLSESTAAYDRGDKFDLYRGNPALADYVLIETARRAVEVRSRQPDGSWVARVFGPGERAMLPGLAIALDVAAVYEDVDVPAAPVAPDGGFRPAG
jgi:Uma2 family endonuclease